MSKRILAGLLLVWFCGVTRLLAYTPKPLPELAPAACPSRQTSQEVSIGAMAYPGKDRCRELFDTDQFFKNGLVPVFLVIHNGNSFPVSFGLPGFTCLFGDGRREPAVSPENLIRIIVMKQQDPQPNYSGTPIETLIRKMSRDEKKIMEDIESKTFNTLTVEPGQTWRGVVFFRLGSAGTATADSQLYIRNIYNTATDEEMMFFEFALGVAPLPEKSKK